MDLINILFAKALSNGDTEEYVNEAIKALKGEVSADLDTLEELSKALGNDPDFFLSVKNELDNKITQEELDATIAEIVTDKDSATDNTRFAIGTAEQTLEVPSMEEFNELKDDVAAITPDDTVVDGKPWTSKKTVDSLCMPIEATGNPVQVYPVAGYPLGVKVSWEPTQEGDGDPSPENIRPITGMDAVSVTRCGKNLVKHLYAPGYTETKNGLTFTVNDDYSITVKGTATKETYFNFKEIKREDFIATYIINAMGRTEVYNGFEIRDIVVQPYPIDHNTRLYLVVLGGKVYDTTYYPTVVYGSTATPYEPYTGDTYNIALPETVYGGTLDLETGEGIKNWERIVLDGSEKWTKRAVNYLSYSLTLPRRAQTGFCTHFKKILYDAIRPDTATGETGCYLEFSASTIFNVPFENVDDWKNYLAAQYAAGTPVYIVFQYANGVNEPFTATGAQPIHALSGVNTLYTDAGTLTVIGREDPRHTIVELKNAIISLGGNI